MLEVIQFEDDLAEPLLRVGPPDVPFDVELVVPLVVGLVDEVFVRVVVRLVRARGVGSSPAPASSSSSVMPARMPPASTSTSGKASKSALMPKVIVPM